MRKGDERMSWDVSATVTEVKEVTTEVYERNVTWNNQPIFMKALGCGFRDLDGKSGREVLPLVSAALENIQSNRAEYEPLEPDNHWGGVDDVLNVLRGLLAACTEYPDCKVQVV